MTGYGINARECVRCAGCATIAPDHFTVGQGPARFLRTPTSHAELLACDAAVALCPTQAITQSSCSSAGADETGAMAIVDGPTARDTPELYPRLLETAEGVRWQIADLPWSDFDAARATPALRAIVREMAYSEQATFSATQRFMQAFQDDPDFSQWISVWFYEETRHPMVLLKWLALAGETPDVDFVVRGRVSAPFMKSRIGTLVTNVISEVFAAEAYRGLALAAPEPLLAAIAQRITADEARHGASFFAWARRAIALSQTPDRERLDALKVLHFWLNENQNVSHPVNETMEKMRSLRHVDGVVPPFRPPNDRVAITIGHLVDLPISSPADVAGLLLDLTRRVHAAGPG